MSLRLLPQSARRKVNTKPVLDQRVEQAAHQHDICPMQLLQQGLILATEGLKHVSTWSAHIQELHSWKLSNHQPQPLRRVNIKQVAESPRDHSLRQQFSPQPSPAKVPAQEEQPDATPHQQSLSPLQSTQQAASTASEYSLDQGDAQMTMSPPAQLYQTADSPSRLDADQQAAAYSAEQITTHLQRLSPSQRLAQSSALKAALAAATAASSPPSPTQTLAISGTDPVLRTTNHGSSAGLFASPAAQAARVYASPEASPVYAAPLLAASASSPAKSSSIELAASPVSPQTVLQTQPAAMVQSVPGLSAVAGTSPVQAGGQQTSPVPIASRGVTVVPVNPDSHVPSAAPASVFVTARQPSPLPSPYLQSVTVDTSLQPLSGAHPAGLPVAQMPVIRPVAAFSYTEQPPAPSAVSTAVDRYVPAIGYSPSRARVARNPPADTATTLIRKQSFAANAVGQWPAVPGVQQQAVASAASTGAPPPQTPSASSSTAVVLQSEVPAPAQFVTLAPPRGAVYGPGVTSRPLTGLVPTGPPQASLHQPPSTIVSAQAMSAPVVVQPQPLPQPLPVPAMLSAVPALSPTAQSGLSSSSTLVTASPPSSSAQSFVPLSAPPAVSATQGGGRPRSAAAVPAIPVAAAPAAAVFSMTTGMLPQHAKLATESQKSAQQDDTVSTVAHGDPSTIPSAEGISSGPLHEGPDVTAATDDEAEVEEAPAAALESDSDAWTDADSDDSLEGPKAGPVGEGVETNSDAWSDSLASEPDSPMGQSPAAAAGQQPAKRSRFGKLLSRGKTGKGLSAPEQQQALAAPPATDAAAPAAAEVSSSAAAAAPAHGGMRSRLFGRARRQGTASALPAVQDEGLDMTNEAEEGSGGQTAVESGEQSDYPQSSTPEPDAITHDNRFGASDEAYQMPLAQHHLVPAAFEVPSSVLPSSSLSATPILSQVEADEEPELDPLSPLFEEQAGSPKPQAPSALSQPMVSSNAGLHHQQQQQLRPMTPTYDEFDPLTATVEEFEAFNRSQEKELASEAQLHGISDAQLPPGIAVSDAAAQPRKTRSMPRLFRLRKPATASASPTSIASDTELADAADLGLDTTQLPADAPGPDAVEETGNPAAATAVVPKQRSRPFGLLRRRGKANTPVTATQHHQQQQSLSADGAEQPNAEFAPLATMAPSADEQSEERQLVREGDGERMVHANTQLGLSAGLPSTFGSFMAAASRPPAGAIPRGPAALPSDLVRSRCCVSSHADQSLILDLIFVSGSWCVHDACKYGLGNSIHH